MLVDLNQINSYGQFAVSGPSVGGLRSGLRIFQLLQEIRNGHKLRLHEKNLCPRM